MRVTNLLKETVEPKSLRRAAVEVAMAALDPDEPFGNDLVRLLAIGNLLYAFATRRDVPQKPNLLDHRILLDTSVVIDLSADEDSTEHRVVRSMIERSIAVGVEVIVPEHVLQERRRVWDAAEAEAGSLRTGNSLGGGEVRLVRNPFSRFYLQELEVDPKLTWGEFARRRREIDKLLVDLGATVRPHGNTRPEDRQLADAIRAGLTDGDAVPEFQRRRTRRSAEADGQSISMVHRWRGRVGEEAAFFVSRGKWSGRVYESVVGKQAMPIEINPEAWVLYLAVVSTDDPSEQSRLAEMVADSAIRTSFFSMASGYTVEEAQVLSDKLRDSAGNVSVDETRAALQLTLLGLLDEADVESATLDKRAAAVIQRRQIRQNSRVIRERNQLSEKIQAVEDQAAAGVAVAKEKASLAEERAVSAEGLVMTKSRSETRYRRLLFGGAPAAAALALLVGLLVGGVFNGWMFSFGLVGLAYYLLKLTVFASDPGADARIFVRNSIAEILLLALIEVTAGNVI